MVKIRRPGSVLGGGFRCSSTCAPDCWFMLLMFSPPAGRSTGDGRVSGGGPGRPAGLWSRQRTRTGSSLHLVARTTEEHFVPTSHTLRRFHLQTRTHDGKLFLLSAPG